MLRKFAKFIIGIFLIPVCIGFSKGYIEWISSIPINALSNNQKYFLYGLLAYLAIHILFRKPLTVYVFGHELTHAIWAKIFGGEVKDLKVSSKGGEVKTTKSNVIITLAPYFFPIYTLIILIIFGIVTVFSKNYQNYIQYYLFSV
ncbi:M50 family metallopeptidase, partial [Candidatus Poribacteria bacterium]|nr:M50 family metallopeptidase [Candidatus Poribacteria bacterium]